MSYVDRVLEPGERILYSTRLHWRALLPAIMFLIAGFASAVAALQAGSAYRLPLLMGAAVLGLLAIASWIPAALRRVSSEFVVTDRRVILKRGVFARHTIEMNRSKVESVDVDQSLLGRIMDYGTVIVRGTGGALEPIRDIAHPVRFRTHITAGAPSH
jgi:uncharacterized membrane protein YdbT with pleckstrin-like domain